MKTRFLLLLLTLIVAISGCTDIEPEPVDTENVYYEPPADYYSLDNRTVNGTEFTYVYNSPLGLESVEVWNIEANYTREEYLNNSKGLIELASSSLFGGNITSVERDNESEHLWTSLNGTLEVESSDGVIKGNEYVFTAYHKGYVYIFNMIEVTQEGSADYEANEYQSFAESVKDTEFR